MTLRHRPPLQPPQLALQTPASSSTRSGQNVHERFASDAKRVHIATDEVCDNCPAARIPWLQSQGTPNLQQYAYDVDTLLSGATTFDSS